ncbi:hypothetical protein ABZS66_04065 [Dactylosporangium sp. NPDC005572]|uniref:hypothetical protein n=1 Tax=Dactylosporangium sp. NPDC005572 TaxID=3156889 RepID=UPI0033AF955F
MAKQWWWRAGIPVLGLVVAVAVGWRLSSEVTVLVVLCAWVPLTAWCLFAPRTRAALPVAVGLLALIATVRWVLPGQPGDRTLSIAWSVLMWYTLPGGLALLVAAWRSKDGPRWLRATATVAAAVALAIGCCGGASLLLFDEPGVPSSAELFPLPAGMDAVSATGPDGANGCDRTGHSCWSYYRVTGAPDESAAALTERLWRHLRENKGWNTDSCQPVGRFGRLTSPVLCVTVMSDPAVPGIGVELSMTDLEPSPA